MKFVDEENNDNVMMEINASSNIKNYFEYLDIITKALSKKLEELEQENKRLEEENSLLRVEAEDRETEFNDLINQDEDITKRFIDLEQKYIDLMEKFEKEQKRIKLLEIENARSNDELKSLRKENKSLLSVSSEREKTSVIERIKKYFN